MISEVLKEKAEQARRDGYVVVNLSNGPMRLSQVIEFAKSLFPTHSLEELAITQADEDQFVIAAEFGKDTRPN